MNSIFKLFELEYRRTQQQGNSGFFDQSPYYDRITLECSVFSPVAYLHEGALRFSEDEEWTFVVHEYIHHKAHVEIEANLWIKGEWFGWDLTP